MHLLQLMPSSKFRLAILGLLFCLTSLVSPANAQNVPPPPNGEAPYIVPPQVPAGTPPMPMVQAPPQGYGMPDPNQPYPQQPYGAPQWGPPQGAPVDPAQMQAQMQMAPQGYPPQGAPGVPGPDPALMAQQGYPPQGYAPPGAPPQYGAPYPPQYPPETPRAMSAYEQQEAALHESEMVGQLEDAKQQKEMEEGFRNGVLAEFEDGKKGTPSSGFNGDQSKVKGGVKKAGTVLKGGMRVIAPTASWIGTMFLLNAATGGF